MLGLGEGQVQKGMRQAMTVSTRQVQFLKNIFGGSRMRFKVYKSHHKSANHSQYQIVLLVRPPVAHLYSL